MDWIEPSSSTNRATQLSADVDPCSLGYYHATTNRGCERPHARVIVGQRKLVGELREAFPAESIDGKTAFADWGGSYPDASEYARAIDGKTWDELDAAYVVRRNDALGFLSIRQLVQLLPVYLRSVIDGGVMSPALDAVLVKLARPTNATSRHRFEALVAALSAPQRAVIAGTLRLIADQDPDGSPGLAARATLDDVWETAP
ncbi:MAG TPA: hypothetical protein VGM88_04495 [Kofleriaceae bacterium]|jgi:hypothetical protein